MLSRVQVEPVHNKNKRNSICAKTSKILSETEEGDVFLGKKEAFDSLDDSEQISSSRASSRAKKIIPSVKSSTFKFPPQMEERNIRVLEAFEGGSPNAVIKLMNTETEQVDLVKKSSIEVEVKQPEI